MRGGDSPCLALQWLVILVPAAEDDDAAWNLSYGIRRSALLNP